MKLYFAHNFNDRFEFRKIELYLEETLGIELYNPFYDDPTRKEEMTELDSIAQKAEDRIKSFENSFNRKQESAELIVKRDLTAIASCDGLFTIVESPSFGTTIEICNATLMKKPIYFVSEKYINHPWIKVYATYKFKNLEEFKSHILLQKNKSL
jgi:nucleoside 2-deoxyribosyltransferase